jgi:hypothetical protein
MALARNLRLVSGFVDAWNDPLELGVYFYTETDYRHKFVFYMKYGDSAKLWD